MLGKRQDSQSDDSDSAQVERAANMYHAGTYPVDHEERARVQAYFAELDRRRAEPVKAKPGNYRNEIGQAWRVDERGFWHTID